MNAFVTICGRLFLVIGGLMLLVGLLSSTEPGKGRHVGVGMAFIGGLLTYLGVRSLSAKQPSLSESDQRRENRTQDNALGGLRKHESDNRNSPK